MAPVMQRPCVEARAMAPRRLLGVFLGVVLQACNCGSTPGVEPPGLLPLELGATQAAGQLTVPAGGGQVTVAEGPLAGLSLTVPPGAWPAGVTLTLAVTPVSAVRLDGVRAGSALVSLEPGGARSTAEPVHVFIPGERSDEEVAMVFGYDRATGELEAMPSYPAPGGTAFATQHFSEYLTLLTQKVKLDEPLPTRFEYGVDDFPMVNEGSYLAPRGFCSGQVVAALSYWADRRLDGGAPLVEYADARPPDGGPSTRRTQAFYADDRRAWQLTSAVQRESVFTLENWDHWRQLQQYAKPERTEQLLSAALYVTKRPQFLTIRRVLEDGGTMGHALLAFGKQRTDAGSRYLISDPNWPWREDAGTPREVLYRADAGFTPYSGRLNSNDATRDYTQFAFVGTWAFVSRDTVRTLWQHFDDDLLGDGFPEATVVARASAVPGNPEAFLVDGLVRTDPVLRVGLNPEPFTWRITVYDASLRELARSSQVLGDGAQVTLAPGDNVLGVRVDGRSGSQVPDYSWVHFRWVTVRYQPPEPNQPVLLGSVTLPGAARGLDVRDGTAYVALDTEGFSVVDVSSPAAPVLRATLDVGAHSLGRGVVVSADQYAFTGVGSFKILDVRDPLAPSVVSGTGFNADCGRLVVHGAHAFVACGRKSYVAEGLLGIASVADAGSGATNRGVGSITWSRTVRDVELSPDGATAFLLGSGGSVAAFDVSAPSAPGTAPLSSVDGDAVTPFAMDREGTTLFVAADGLRLVNAATPTALAWLGGDPYRDVRDVDAFGTTAVAVGVDGNAGRLWVYDVTDPLAPTVTKRLELAQPATAVKVVGGRAYVTTGTGAGAGALLIIAL